MFDFLPYSRQSGRLPKPRRKTVQAWVILVIAPIIAACDQDNATRRAASGISQEVSKLRQQVDELRARPSLVHITFQNLMPLATRDAKSGFVSLVIFPEEAQIKVWRNERDRKNGYEDCKQAAQTGGNAVCPETEFHKMLLDPLLSELAGCGSADKPVQLKVVAFASSSTVKKINQFQKDEIDREVQKTDCACRCVSDGCYAEKFNLIIANLRAVNTVKMMESLIDGRPIEVKHEPWKSHCEMVKHRGFDDRAPCGQYLPNKGLMNRRAEIRIAALPACTFFSLPDGQDADES